MADARLAVVAAGGTGGHLFPAEALARALTDRGWRIVLATDARGAQYAQHFPAEERLALEAATFRAGDVAGMVRGGLRILAGVRQARQAFRRLKPAIVVGFGGYPSLPALLAARGAKVPTLIHEQNAVLGRVNRFVAPRVDAVACAFPTLEKAPLAVKAKTAVVGNPVRPEVRALYDRPYAAPGGTIHLLVTGGSQGARLLSELVPDAVALLPEELRLRLRVEQQTRMESMETARHTYGEAGVEAEIAPFFRNIAAKLEVAHLVIGRAGASTVCELAVAGLPSILVPLAIAADDHQRFNAKLLADVGAAEVVLEKELTAEGLAERLAGLLADPEGLARRAAAARSVAQPEAAERLAELVEATARP
jgi:UDP-N-acetylglucosamine--N-acetylmuramyl-(pentapeptide) pyrophosphoryl-undecaprenol N-acetylglucosamine transferase